jgi:hypothetical protein
MSQGSGGFCRQNHRHFDIQNEVCEYETPPFFVAVRDDLQAKKTAI